MVFIKTITFCVNQPNIYIDRKRKMYKNEYFTVSENKLIGKISFNK